MKNTPMATVVSAMLALMVMMFPPLVSAQKKLRTKDGTSLKVDTLAGGLKHPWGMAFLFPNWHNNLLIGGLTTGEVVRLVVNGTAVIEEERLQLQKRIRDVDIGPDGSIYLLTDHDDGNVLRISSMGKP